MVASCGIWHGDSKSKNLNQRPLDRTEGSYKHEISSTHLGNGSLQSGVQHVSEFQGTARYVTSELLQDVYAGMWWTWKLAGVETDRRTVTHSGSTQRPTLRLSA